MASAAASSDPAVLCDKCQQQFKVSQCSWINKSICQACEAKGTVRKAIYRCRDCASVAVRLAKMKREDPDCDPTATMNPEERITFFSDAKGMGSDALKKHVQESTTKTKEVQKHEDKKMVAPAIPVTTARKLQKYIDNPGCLERLLANPAMSFTCPLSGMAMVRDPEWTLEQGTREVEKDASEMTASADTVIKGAKPPKKTNPTKVGPLPKKLVMTVNKDLKSTLESMQQVQTSLVIATSGEGQKWVTPACAEKVEKALRTVQGIYTELTQLIQAGKGETKDKVASLKDELSKANNKLAEVYTVLEGAVVVQAVSQTMSFESVNSHSKAYSEF